MMKYRWREWTNELVNRNINFDFSSLDKFPLSLCYIGAAQRVESIAMYKVVAGYVWDVDNELSSEELGGNSSLLFFCECLSRDSSNLEMCVRFFISKSTPHGAIFHFTFISRSTTLLLSSICSRLFVCCSRSLFIPWTQGNKYRTAKRSWYKSQKIDSVSFAIWIEMKMFLQRSTFTSLTRLYF